MAQSMNSLVTELSKQLDDWFEGTADANASNATYTLVDTELVGKQSDWISTGAGGEMPTTLYIKTDSAGAGAAPEGEERVVNAAIASNTTITVSSTYAFSGSIASGDTYEIHRKWTRQEKEQAIVYGCKVAYPQVYKEVQDRSIVFGDWLVNGDFEGWAVTTAPDSWTVSTCTASENTTEAYVHGLPTSSSMKLAAAGSGGSVYQSTAENNDLWMLAGRAVTFYAWVYTSGASEVSLCITDGTTTTYGNHSSHTASSLVYHPGDSTWRLMWVTQTIATNPSAVTFTIYYTTSTADAYVDQAHVIGNDKYSYDINHVGLYDNRPLQIYRLRGADASDTTPEPNPLRIRIDKAYWSLEPGGKISFNRSFGSGTRLELVGMAQLTTPTSLYGSSSSSVSTEIDDIYKEGQIVIAEAAKYLMKLRINSGVTKNREVYIDMLQFWENECKARRSKYAMRQIPV